MKVTPQQAAVLLRRRAQALDAALRQAEKENLQEALRIARKLSSGTISSAQLRAMGHPYRLGGSPPAPPEIINAQSGRFRDSWRATGPFATRGGLVSRLVNTAPWAAWLFGGTARMIARPIGAAIQRRVVALRYRRLQAAAAKALLGE